MNVTTLQRIGILNLALLLVMLAIGEWIAAAIAGVGALIGLWPLRIR
ncbi:hypothetical protein ACFFLM_04355 [Deinococcus oregonensis]|uniref:Uncharacterized protein n=1 Tax=Deinococcus oregonensis TaxID=1805970 RepID=A0ABV6AUP0_9DEIO